MENTKKSYRVRWERYEQSPHPYFRDINLSHSGVGNLARGCEACGLGFDEAHALAEQMRRDFVRPANGGLRFVWVEEC